jgi:hypothetical protein
MTLDSSNTTIPAGKKLVLRGMDEAINKVVYERLNREAARLGQGFPVLIYGNPAGVEDEQSIIIRDPAHLMLILR